MSENPAPLRATRAAMFAAVCTAVGALGHAHMSGTDAPPAGLLAAFGATGSLAWLGAGRRRGPAAIAAALLTVQGVLHLVLSVSRTPGPASGHRHPSGTDLSAMATGTGHGGAGMIAAHLLAGVFCAAWLAWGEAAVFRLLPVLGSAALLAARPLARALVLVRARVAPVPRPPAPRPRYAPPRRLRGAVHAHAVVRRGPPRWRTTRATAPGRPAHA
ncbi:hypothetical protein [Streptomyces sp. NPDC051567]|uniref:hypothetical protein n=1 Tax=Streptomyces sp. NPDC051567 TaxID=3365660 RepID=UPI0037A61BBE